MTPWGQTWRRGRRNLTSYQRAELALKLKPLVAAKAKDRKAQAQGQPRGKKKASHPPISAGETRDALAKEAGIGHDTLAKAEFLDRYADDETKRRLR